MPDSNGVIHSTLVGSHTFFYCPRCHATLDFDPLFGSGGSARCPKCGVSFRSEDVNNARTTKLQEGVFGDLMGAVVTIGVVGGIGLPFGLGWSGWWALLTGPLGFALAGVLMWALERAILSGSRASDS